jgi:galactose mutarotase-like enzyme
MTDLTTIASESLSADIHPLGAQLFALRDGAGHDLQWNGDPAVWKGRAPILFPIVGALAGNQYRLDGQTFALPRHGFARDRLFALVEATAASALFRLRWDDESLKLYPFRFELDLRFSLEGATLHMVATARNLEGDKTMPASFGFHPALCWPLPYGQPRKAHALTFEKSESAPVRRLNDQGLLLPATFDTPVASHSLPLRDDLFAGDAIIFDAITSRSLRYGADTGPQIEFAFPGMPQLGVWTKPGADFVCIEPWHGFADPEGFDGDLRDKPGMALLPPGGSKDFALSMSWRP